MTSIPGSDNLIWSDEQTRFYLELRFEENLKGNIRNHIVNEVGKQTIISKFYDAFGEKHTWIKFRNKFNTCKKQYSGFKKLTHRTGMSYYPNGSIDMSDDWWDERYKEWPGARKIKDKSVPNADLMEQMLGSIHITGAEGWSAQQGESHLDNNMMLDDDEAGSESRQEHDAPAASNAPTASNAPSTSNAPAASNVPKYTRKRRAGQAVEGQAVADVIRDSIQSRDEILSYKNQLMESHPDYSCSQLRAMRVLNSLSSIRMWSPLFKAAMKHLKEDATNRQTFISFEDDENKVLYLEFETGESRDW